MKRKKGDRRGGYPLKIVFPPSNQLPFKKVKLKYSITMIYFLSFLFGLQLFVVRKLVLKLIYKFSLGDFIYLLIHFTSLYVIGLEILNDIKQ